MKKSLNFVFLFLISILLISCVNTKTTTNNNYTNDIDDTGFNLLKSSVSDATLELAIDKLKVLNKPSNLGKVTLVDLADVEVKTKPFIEMTDKDIDIEIEKIRDKEITYEQIKDNRQCEIGDRVTIDYVGTINGKEFEGGKAENQQLILGEKKFIEGFEEKIVGHRVNESFDINLKFPDNYYEELAGKPVKFKITLKLIEEKVVPELNSEFFMANSKNKASTSYAFRKEIKETKDKLNKYTSEIELQQKIIDELTKLSKCEPNEEAYAWCFSKQLSEIKKQSSLQGANLVDLFKYYEISIKDGLNQIMDQSMEVLPSEMILAELEKKYNINVTEKDMEDWFNRLVKIYDFSGQITYDQYKQNAGEEFLKEQVRNEKIIDIVKDKIKITYEEDIVEDVEEELAFD